jgi:hypothetical protein
VGAEPLVASTDEDVAFINSAVSLANLGKDVVVVMHSYGGIPGSDAMKGLSNVLASRSPPRLVIHAIRLS